MPPPRFDLIHRNMMVRLPRDVAARGLVVDRQIVAFNPLPAEPEPVPNIFDLPDLASRQGSLFFVTNRPDGEPPAAWYIPSFVFAAKTESDSAFLFEAVRVGDAPGGVPVHRCSVTLTLLTVVPPDATAWLANHPGGNLNPLPMENLIGGLMLVVANPEAGAVKMLVIPGIITPLGGNRYKLLIEPIVGGLGELAYNQFTRDATLKISVSLSYRGWRMVPRPPLPPGAMTTMIARFEAALVAEDSILEVGNLFAAGEYAQRYTLITAAGSRTILGPDDLRSSGPPPTEYRELILPGDLTARYPSIRALYFGVVSRRVMVIPMRYVMLRDRTTCGAACRALVDSSPALPSGCKFAFDFTLIPDVSPIDMLRLLAEIDGLPEATIRGATLTLPASIHPDRSTMLTPFATSVQFAVGANARSSVALNMQVRNVDVGNPSVTNANLLLMQLRSDREPFLTGTVSILLDSAFTTPILVPVQLSLTNTQPIDSSEITLAQDSATNEVVLTNSSSFPLSIRRVALTTTTATTLHEPKQTLTPNESLRLPLPADSARLVVNTDAEFQLPAPIPGDIFQRLIRLDTVDVQNTQHPLHVVADAVPWETAKIERLEVVVSFRFRPNVALPPFRLLPTQLTDSRVVVVPVAQAVINLDAIVSVEMELSGGLPKRTASLDHDFSQNPTLLLTAQMLGLA